VKRTEKSKKISSISKIIVIFALSILMLTIVAPSLVLAIEVIVDDVSASFVGTWKLSTGISGYYGSGYRINDAGSGSATATWDFTVPTEGSWEVFARWTSYDIRATNAPYTVNHKHGSTVVRFNQKVNGGLWISLGIFSFDAGSASVVLSDDADGWVCADAIKIVEVTAPPTEPIEVILDEPIEVTEELDPFQVSGQEIWDSGPQSIDFIVLTIPVGKMLVIEHVSAKFTTSGGGVGDIDLSVKGVYNAETQLLYLGRCEDSVFSDKGISKEVKFYCDPETEAGFSLIREVEIQYQTFTFYYTVTGYFIDVT
jgi:hypothetical protein